LPPAPLALSRNRDFTLLWAGRTVSVVGSQVSGTAYPLLVLALTGSPATAGLVLFLAWLPYPLFALPAGWLVDRAPRKALMLSAEIGRGVTVATIVAALWFDALTIEQVMVVAFVEGTLFVVADLVEVPAVRHVVGPTQLTAALSLIQARSHAALLAGRPIAGALFDLGRALPFVADAISYLVSTAAFALVRSRLQGERDAPARRPVAELFAGVVWLWHQPFLRMIPVLSFGVNLLFQGIVLLVIVAAREQGASATTIGIVLGAGGVGGVLGAFAAPRIQRRVHAKRVVVGAIWYWAVVLPLLAVAANPVALAVVFGALAFTGPIWNVATSAYAVAITPDALLGRMQAVARLVGLAGIPLGGLTAGVLLERAGPATAAVVLAVLMAIVAVAGTISRGVRDAPELEALQ